MFNDYDVFDLANALYHWLQHNWEGQADPLYSVFCQLTAPGMYKPGMSEEYFENMTDDVAIIYDQLTVDNYQEALDKVLNYKSEE